MTEAVKYYLDYGCEEIGGKIVAMAPRPGTKHASAAGNIYRKFGNYLEGKQCRVFAEVEVFLAEGETYIPDIVVVCDKGKIKENGIHGAPDLVVEVLSPSTGRYDRKIKKAVYERCGVKEYWIVSAEECSIEVYLPVDGRLELDNVYAIVRKHMIERARRGGVELEDVREFKTTLFDDLSVSLDDVFAGIDF